jgi:hypothetical protein
MPIAGVVRIEGDGQNGLDLFLIPRSGHRVQVGK